MKFTHNLLLKAREAGATPGKGTGNGQGTGTGGTETGTGGGNGIETDAEPFGPDDMTWTCHA